MKALWFGARAGAVTLAALGWTADVRAEVVMITSSRDNTIYEVEGSKSNGAGVHMHSGMNGDGNARRALVWFDVAANVPAGAVINSVSVELECTNSTFGSGARTHTLNRITTDWGEGTSNAGTPGEDGAAATTNDATWFFAKFSTSSWSNGGADYVVTPSGSVSVNAVGTYTIGSTSGMVSDVQGWLASPSTNFGWIFIGDEQVPGVDVTLKRFATREDAVSGNRPTLIVDFTGPVPTMPEWGLAAMALVLVASGAFVIARRARARTA